MPTCVPSPLGATPLDPAPSIDQSFKRFKRPYSLGDASASVTREIQPRPPTFASVNGQPASMPTPIVMSPVEPPRKKRGRPTKSEFERRQAEALARGEVWPKPRKIKPPRASMEAVETTGSTEAAGNFEVGESGPEGVEPGVGSDAVDKSAPIDSGGSAPVAVMYAASTLGQANPESPVENKKKRPFDNELQPAGQVQHEELRAAEAGGNADTPTSEFEAQQNLLSEMRHNQLATNTLLQHGRGDITPTPMQSSFTAHHGLPFPGYQIEERQGEQQQR